jgi:hypothetical protein
MIQKQVYENKRRLMPRERNVQTVESATLPEEYIGHITTPIEENNLECIQNVLKHHAVNMLKCRTDDNWWTLLLPDGTTKRKKERPGKMITYTIRLPDGFWFLLEAGILNRDGTYDIPPWIGLEEEKA